MKILEVKDRTPILIEQLLEIWEASVKATHLFLSAAEIENIKSYVPQALKEVSHLIVLENEERLPLAFMGLEKQKLEMLFIAPQVRGCGFGRALMKYGINNHSINELTVNEQNSLAKGFYDHMGFHVYKRTDEDEQGNPYPLLYMRLG